MAGVFALFDEEALRVAASAIWFLPGQIPVRAECHENRGDRDDDNNNDRLQHRFDSPL
jgi:hypothetical protein